MPSPTPSKARVINAIEGAKQAGLAIGEVRVLPDGTLQILASGASSPVSSDSGGNTCDNLFGAASD